jgi:hypothetical protein
MTDAFDRFWEWRDKPPGSRLEIPGQLYSAVMSLPEVERSNRELVNESVRENDEAQREGGSYGAPTVPARRYRLGKAVFLARGGRSLVQRA